MSVLPIEYEYDRDTGNIVLPQGAPFDGSPVLIKLAAGWCEAWWVQGETTETQDGKEYDGFHWVCMDDQFQAELDEAEFWTALPEAPRRMCEECGQNSVEKRGEICEGCDAYREHTGHF